MHTPNRISSRIPCVSPYLLLPILCAQLPFNSRYACLSCILVFLGGILNTLICLVPTEMGQQGGADHVNAAKIVV